MPRKLWSSHLTSLSGALLLAGLIAGCANGGALDPFDNFSGGSTNPNPPISTDVPLCDSDAPTARCKIVLDDLAFTEAADCNIFKSDTFLGGSWSHPSGAKERLQFAGSEGAQTAPCGPAGDIRQCTMTLSNIPGRFASIKASQIKLTFMQKYNFASDATTASGKLDGLKISLGVLRFGGADVLTQTNSRHDSGGKPELAPLTVWLTPAAGGDRSVTFSVRTQCYNSGGVPAYWYLEQVVAEIQP